MKIKSNILVLITATAITSMSTSFASTSIAADQVQQMLDLYRINHHIPGMALNIRIPDTENPGEYVYSHYTSGTKDLQGQQAITPDTLFQMGGNTQSYLAALTLQFIAAKQLSLDDHISKYLSNYPLWQNVTIKQLLNHTSGIPDYQDNADFQKNLTQYPEKSWSPAELLTYAQQQLMYFLPGQGWHYSHSNPVILGLLLEKISGQSLTQLIQNNLLNKPELKLKQTFYLPKIYPTNIYSNMAHGYYAMPQHWFPQYSDVTRVNMSSVDAAGSMIASTNDLMQWTIDLFNGPALNDTQRQQMLNLVCAKPAQASHCQPGQTISKDQLQPGDSAYGLGVMTINDPNYRNNGTIWYHGMGEYGYQGSFFYWPGLDTAMAIIGNIKQNTIKDDYLSLVQGIMKVIW